MYHAYAFARAHTMALYGFGLDPERTLTFACIRTHVHVSNMNVYQSIFRAIMCKDVYIRMQGKFPNLSM